MKRIGLHHVDHVAFTLAKELLSFDEPIPDFATRFRGALESCLLTPFQKFSKRPLYQSLVSKVAILFYLMIKNHPFQNGNKRVAVTTVLTFLHMNKRWLAVDERELYNFTVWVAASPAQLKDQVVEGIAKFFGSHLVKLDK